MPLPPRVISAWLGDTAAYPNPEHPIRESSLSAPHAQELQSPSLKRPAPQDHCDACLTAPTVKAEPGVTARKRRRIRAQATPQPRRSERRALHETMANMLRTSESPDPLNTSKRKPRQPSQQPSGRSGRAAGSRKDSAASQQPHLEKEKKPRGRPRKARAPDSAAAVSASTSIEARGNLVLLPSTSQYSESRYGEELASMEQVTSEPASNATSTTTSRKSKSRNRSPVKSLEDMHIFDKPVFLGFVNKERPIPEVLRPHWNALEDICANIGIIPHSIKAEFEEEERLRPGMLSPAPATTSRESIRLEHRDFEEVCEVRDTTVQYWAQAHEAGWNSKIHQKILDRALKPHKDRYESHNVTTAKPIKAFAPAFKDDLKDPKVVDFVITHIPPTAFKRNIQALLRDRVDDDEQRTINQTSYLRYQPSLLPIETKKGYNDELDANFKLAMWTTAWQEGISRFTPPGTRCTPLPGIIVYGHVWELQWAVDTEDVVYFIKHPEPIGNTATLAGCYRLLAALRYLISVWSEEVFLPWFVEKVVGDK